MEDPRKSCKPGLPLKREVTPTPTIAMSIEIPSFFRAFMGISSFILTATLTVPISQLGKPRHRDIKGRVGRTRLCPWVLGSSPALSMHPTGAGHRVWREGPCCPVNPVVRCEKRCFLSFLAPLHGLWDLSSLTRD